LISQLLPTRRRYLALICRTLVGTATLAAARVAAGPVDFDVAAQSADGALMDFARQAKVEVIFSFDELHKAESTGVVGKCEPEDALNRLLTGTGFTAHRNARGRFVVVRILPPVGSIRGKLVLPDGRAAAGVRVMIPAVKMALETSASGEFVFTSVEPGSYQIFASGRGFQTLQVDGARVVANRVVTLDNLVIKVALDPAPMEPFVVEAHSARPVMDDGREVATAPRTAIGNLDKPRSEDDSLSYGVFDRDQIIRSGVINLNDFLKQELLDSDATTLPPNESGATSSFVSGSSNLNLRGYGADATIILVNGRRLPEIVTALPGTGSSGAQAPQADVNVIPISMIERVEVLPASASAIYSGSPVGGVINIVLRPDINTTELTTTYTNALAGSHAPESTISLLHGETLLGGALRVRLNATYTQVTPPTEAELGYIRSNLLANPQTEDQLFRATPNVSSAGSEPLFGPGTPNFTSVAAGADGSGGLASFANRQGIQSLNLFQPLGGGLADSPDSLGYPYGRKQKGFSLFGSVTYDATPWLQLGVDASAGRTVNSTGYSVFEGSLNLPASSPFNPFGQSVNVTLNETAPHLGEDYDEAHIDYYSAVAGLLLKMPWGWQASVDAQYGLSITDYRGVEGVDPNRWQQLVNEGIYNPLRDTQAFGPPQQFYDQVLIFYGTEGSFARLGDYNTFDGSVRLTNTDLRIPTGVASVTVGSDFRYEDLATYVDTLRYGDGTLVSPPDEWVGRSLQRISVFGEVEAPLVPKKHLPSWILDIDADIAARYTASDVAHEANLAPTGAIKVDFAGGLTLRGSYATSNRFPTPVLSSEVVPNSGGAPGSGIVSLVDVFDPVLDQYENVQASDAPNPNLKPEAAVTQTVGMIFQRGDIQRLRVSVDFADTVTSGEETYLDTSQVVDLENLLPGRVVRTPEPGGAVGPITAVYTGTFNLAWRHSYEWTTSFDYAWTDCLGGTLEAYCRWIYFQRYDIEFLPTLKPVDELRDPDGSTAGLLKHRMNFGVGWSDRAFGFGIDGHYYHSRILPMQEWPAQGSDEVSPYTQLDAYVQRDLGGWLPWKSSHFGIRGQARVDNIFDAGPPKFADDPTGAGVQSYGDWRRRVYSLSVTVTY
jgi:iron complex outermembrane receptor protein